MVGSMPSGFSLAMICSPVYQLIGSM